MKLRVLFAYCLFLFAPAAFAAPLHDEPPVAAAPEQFQVTQKTEVPNTTLSPGNYTIRVLDHLRDRVILQVAGRNDHVQTTFIAIPASTMANAPVGPIPFTSGPKGKAALKGFAFPGGLAVEFVYPKNDAVSIAQANETRVMAIDPASEGRVPAPKLSQNDMQMITLWMLEPSRVGAPDSKPGIAASKYQAPATSATAPVQTAEATVPPPPATANQASGNTASSDSTPETPAAPRPVHRARPTHLAQNDVPAPPPARTHTRPAGVKALPHTASSLPMLWLGALLSLFVGSALTLRRLAVRG